MYCIEANGRMVTGEDHKPLLFSNFCAAIHAAESLSVYLDEGVVVFSVRSYNEHAGSQSQR